VIALKGVTAPDLVEDPEELWRFTHLSDDETVAKMGHPAITRARWERVCVKSEGVVSCAYTIPPFAKCCEGWGTGDSLRALPDHN
jgi:hypothetical protein